MDHMQFDISGFCSLLYACTLPTQKFVTKNKEVLTFTQWNGSDKCLVKKKKKFATPLAHHGDTHTHTHNVQTAHMCMRLVCSHIVSQAKRATSMLVNSIYSSPTGSSSPFLFTLFR